jgi:hypothetical protein
MGGVLIVVDHHMVEPASRSPLEQRDGLVEKRGEVSLAGRGQGLQIPAIERRYLLVFLQARAPDETVEVIRIEEPLLSTEDEVRELPSEPRHLQKMVEPRPIIVFLAGEKLTDDRVLFGGGENLRGRVIPELSEVAADRPEGEPMHGGNRKVGE